MPQKKAYITKLIILVFLIISVTSIFPDFANGEFTGVVSFGVPEQYPTTTFSRKDILGWQNRSIDEKNCIISPVIDFGKGHEVNHHRVKVFFSGKGSVELSLVHSASSRLEQVLKKRYLRSRFKKIESGQEVVISSRYKGERFVWLLISTDENVLINKIQHTCWKGKDTLYGHYPGEFEYKGGKLPFRLMFPRNYNPQKKYPLVLSVGGSGGIGSDNVRSMEMVILARYLFTNYYYDENFEAFSLVPQIQTSPNIPAPYWPGGKLGGPDRQYHPDWPAVNENGWYSQATITLIKTLILDREFSIDPNRIYYSGFSYGGKGCWEFLKADRKLFAAAMSGGGWPIGRAYSQPNQQQLQRLALEVSRYKHVPATTFAGAKDSMRFGSKAVHEEILSQGGKSRFLEIKNANHTQSAGRAWGNPDNIEWLFKQNRKNNPAPGKDPFGGGKYPEPSSKPTSQQKTCQEP